MSVFELNSRNLWEVLISCFHLKKTVAEAHRILSSTYVEAALSERTCREWFQRFKSGNFDVEDMSTFCSKEKTLGGHTESYCQCSFTR